MIRENHSYEKRNNKLIRLETDLVVVGGGMAGICSSITAARQGIKVVLIQDRPVLGGNASSEVRLWILGATSHMGNNNRWAREGGVIDEILLDNLYRNREGNPLIFDTILLEKVGRESNITLLLNTGVYQVKKSDSYHIKSVKAFCSQNSTEYLIAGKYFCDASGDGIVAFQAGASFRMGAETKEEFGEKFAPDLSYGELLGHSMYFYSKQSKNPVNFVAPDYALKDIKEIPRYKVFNQKEHGCWLWWIEYGGRKDTIHDTEEIKWELWKIIYGVWDYIKNSGEFEDVENLTLEWVSTIPGKRESRRFEGHYMLKQQDIISQREFDDAVSFGGWSIDLHPADGIYSELPGCNQWHSKGVYQIPYRCYISRDIQNLFYAGRIISASHVAFGSTRVMATCAHGGQAVGMAAAICLEKNLKPVDLLEKGYIRALQKRLNQAGQTIPGIPIDREGDLVKDAKITPSSTYKIAELPFNGPWISLKTATAQILPMERGSQHTFTFQLKAEDDTDITCELRISSKIKNFTPDTTLKKLDFNLKKGAQWIDLDFEMKIPETQYVFITFLRNEKVWIKGSKRRMTGILSVFNKQNKAVSNYGKQNPPANIGVDSFEFWTPERRPGGYNLGIKINPPLEPYNAINILNGYTKPYIVTNAWVADPEDPDPYLRFEWGKTKKIKKIHIHFDTDFDHPLESSLLGHSESVVPFVVRKYTVTNGSSREIASKDENHQTINVLEYDPPLETTDLEIHFDHPSKEVPAAVFEISCF
jgi:hypothetical protein